MSSIKLKGSSSGEAIISTASDGSSVILDKKLDVQGNEIILDADNDTSIIASTDDQIDFKTSGTDRMSVNSDGTVGIGDTTTSSLQSSNGTTKQFYWQGNYGVFVSHEDVALLVNRQSTAGKIISIRQAGGEICQLGESTNIGFGYIGGGNSGVVFNNNGRILPATSAGVATDNSFDLGQSNYRWDDIYATNGTIQTSDENEKQSIESLTTAEMNVAKRLSSLFKTFKFNSSVEKKGDNARTHTGIIAQSVQQAFTDESLNASNYALFTSNTWWEKEVSVDKTTDEDGNVVEAHTYIAVKDEETEGYTQKTRLGIRYPELLSFIQAYNDQRFTSLETRITALENN